MASACAWFFNDITQGKIQYQRVLLGSVLFSLVFSNVGLTELIRISIPFLTAIYPVVIVLVILSLGNGLFGGRTEVYRWSLGLTFFFSIFDGLNAAGLQITAVNLLLEQYLPLYGAHLGWVIPALLGALFGGMLSCAAKKEAEAQA